MEEFRAEAGDRFTLDDYIDQYVVLIATADDDFSFHSYFMYNNSADGRWYFIQWDHDMAFERSESPINYGTQACPPPIPDSWNRLQNKILEDPLFRYAYCKKLERFLQESFNTLQIQNHISDVYDEIHFDAIRDVHKSGRERPDLFYSHTDSLYIFAEDRVPFLLNEISSYITNPALAPYFRLNEIQSNNQSTIADEAGDFDPWVELHNSAPVELDLTDFTLHYGADSWVLPPEAVVDDYGCLLLWLDGEPGEGPLHASFALSSGGGNLWLEGRMGGTVDNVTFPDLSEDQVWARVEDGVGEWVGYLPPTPGTTNTPLEDPSPLVVNELLAINDSVNMDSAGDYDDWLEIYNPSQNTIPLGGIYLTDNFDRPTKWAFPDTSIAPGGFLIVWCDDEPVEGSMHATFKLSGGGEEVGIFDRDGVTPIDTFSYPPQQADISYGRYPDGSDDWGQRCPTPGEPNVMTSVPGENSDTFIPQDFSLEQNFPNPFNSRTLIRYAIPHASHVRMVIYNVLGREVVVLKDERLETSYYNIVFDSVNLPSGLYFCCMEAGDFTSTRKMLLLR